MEGWNEGGKQARLLSLLTETWVKGVTKEDGKRAETNHTVKMMMKKEYHTKVVNWTRAKVARNFNRQSLRNALLIAVSGDRQIAAIWGLDVREVGSQTICLQSISARMSCKNMMESV